MSRKEKEEDGKINKIMLPYNKDKNKTGRKRKREEKVYKSMYMRERVRREKYIGEK